MKNTILIAILFTGCTVQYPNQQQYKQQYQGSLQQPQQVSGVNTCWDGSDTVNCRIKSIKKNLRILDFRVKDSLNGWGDCCGG